MLIATQLLIISLGFVLLNLYGLTRSMRFKAFDTAPEDLFRFGREMPMPYKEALLKIKQLEGLDDKKAYVESATLLVSQSLAHLEWNKLNPIKNYQVVPIWENPFLWVLGRFSNIAHYNRYNFTNYKRTLERGYGICGDASIVLSQLLEKKAINHHIVAFSAHVLVEAALEDRKIVLDPDFGVVTRHSLDELAKTPRLAYDYYVNAGYRPCEGEYMAALFQKKSFFYKNVYAFVPKRYILERASYPLYWFGPPTALVVCVLWIFVNI